MKVMTGTKREITVFQWKEVLEKYMGRANNSMECFCQFEEADDLDHLIEDCEALLKNAKQAKKAIEFMDYNGIK